MKSRFLAEPLHDEIAKPEQIGNADHGRFHASFQQQHRDLHLRRSPMWRILPAICLIRHSESGRGCSIFKGQAHGSRRAALCFQGEAMPYVSISTAKGILDVEQKQSLLQRITDLMVEIEGQGNPEFRKLVWVKIEEQDPSHWSLGGLTASPEYIAQIYGMIGADGRRTSRAKA
jgi:4-oxalocrotonate tautomerase